MPVMERNVMKLRKCVGLNSIVLLSCFHHFASNHNLLQVSKAGVKFGCAKCEWLFYIKHGKIDDFS